MYGIKVNFKLMSQTLQYSPSLMMGRIIFYGFQRKTHVFKMRQMAEATTIY